MKKVFVLAAALVVFLLGAGTYSLASNVTYECEEAKLKNEVSTFDSIDEDRANQRERSRQDVKIRQLSEQVANQIATDIVLNKTEEDGIYTIMIGTKDL